METGTHRVVRGVACDHQAELGEVLSKIESHIDVVGRICMKKIAVM
jgi:hypothetical protein